MHRPRPDAELGPHTLQVTGLDPVGTEQSVSLAAELPAPADAPKLPTSADTTVGAGGHLAVTGSATSTFVLTAAWLLLGGTVLLEGRGRHRLR